MYKNKSPKSFSKDSCKVSAYFYLKLKANNLIN